jgi:hypothetical protein
MAFFFVWDQYARQQSAISLSSFATERWRSIDVFPDSSKPLVQTIVKVADILARDKTVSAQEIELWIRHVGPVWMANPDWMRKAVENWYSAMQQLGLKPAGTNEMENFIRRGIIRAEFNET